MRVAAIVSVLVLFALLACASIARSRVERAGHDLARGRTARDVAESTAAQIRGIEAALSSERTRIEALRAIPHEVPTGVALSTALALAPAGVVLDRFALDVRRNGDGPRRFEVAIDGFATDARLAGMYAEALRSSGLTDGVTVRSAGERTLRGRSVFDFALRFETPLDATYELVASAGEFASGFASESESGGDRRE